MGGLPERPVLELGCSFSQRPLPTIGGMLILGKRPQGFLPSAYVLFLRIAGTELSDEVVAEEICNGSVADLIRRLEAKLATHNRPAIALMSGARRSIVRCSRWAHCGNLLATPSCIRLTQVPTRLSGCGGSRIAAQSSAPADRTAP